MKLYTLEIKSINEAFPIELLKYLSEERREKIKRYRFKTDQLLSLYAALIVRMGIIEVSGIRNNMLNFNIEKNGKPYLENDRNLQFNFSHTKNYILCGISFKGQIGVDVENYTNSTPYDIVERCFHDNEIAFLNRLTGEEKAEFFYHVWTRKEAYIKFHGLGLSMDIRKIDTFQETHGQYYRTWKDNTYICSTYSKDKEPPELICLREQDLYSYFLQFES